ncbi:site-specific integrase [Ruminococcaceae bacterium OttesenSCG-928-A16]|nr:site-specific integrase [Ruminococcaceae bacterium OttesenSCG-928-A16]
MKKRKDGRYSLQFVIGREQAFDDNGDILLDKKGRPVIKYKRYTVYGATQKEVNEAAAQAKIDFGKGIDIAAANDNFSLWATRFIQNKKAQGLSPGHITRLNSNLKHLAPLNLLPISKITIGDIQAIIDTLAQWQDGKPPRAKKTLLGIKQAAGQIFKLAIASRVITYNPAEFITIPKTAKQNKRTALTDEQQRWVRETEHRAKRAAMIMLYSGLRRGELLALTWADINLDNNTIAVNKSVIYESNQPILKHSAKTASSIRTVKIPVLLGEYLAGEKAKDNCLYVVHSRNGLLMSESAWSRMWESYMAALNLKYGYSAAERENENITSVHNPNGLQIKIPTFTAHQLRHTFCTMMYLAGVDVLVASKQMGHADVQTTLRIYAHLSEEHKNTDLKKLDDMLLQSIGSQAEIN